MSSGSSVGKIFRLPPSYRGLVPKDKREIRSVQSEIMLSVHSRQKVTFEKNPL